MEEGNHGGAREGAGRPKSLSTIRTQEAREYITEQVKKSLEPIVARAINDAILGDKDARNWLSDRGWGKPVQPVSGPDGEENVLGDLDKVVTSLLKKFYGEPTS